MIEMSNMSRRERNKALARLSAYARQLYYLIKLPGNCREKFTFKAKAWETNARVLATKLGRDFEADRNNVDALVVFAASFEITVIPVRQGVPMPPWERPSDWQAARLAKLRERAAEIHIH